MFPSENKHRTGETNTHTDARTQHTRVITTTSYETLTRRKTLRLKFTLRIHMYAGMNLNIRKFGYYMY